MAQQDLRQEWELRIADYRSSGLTQMNLNGVEKMMLRFIHFITG